MSSKQNSQRALTGQHLLPTSLRAAIIASSYWLLSLPLTVASGSIASFLGCLFACYLIDLGIRRKPLNRLRSFTINFLSITFLIGGLLLASLVTSTSLLSNLASAMFSFNAGEFIKWFSISASLTVCLRVLAQRTSYGAVIEILFVATAFVITLSAHRNGMIHRPFFIGDYALTRGIDPSTILMAFGCVAVLSLAALLMIENNHRRLPYHFTVLGLLCFSLLFYVRMFGLPTPQLTDDLGLTGQEQTGKNTQRENPFRDSENNADEKEAPVAVVVFRDDYEPLNGSYYFRESAYSQFNGTMLDFTSRRDMDQDLIANFTNSRIESNQLPKAEDQRVAVRATIGMLISHRTPFGLESPVAYENTANPNNLRFKRTYDAYSLAPEYDFNYLLGRELGRADWSAEVWDEYLRLPDDPRYQELASNLIAGLRPEFADDPFAKAWAVKTYLDEKGIYSLKNEHAYEADPAGSFLFGDLTGYCMHFSFAATYMFRSLGIPARVGIGYSVPASNKAGGSSLLIQAIHGHAWPEIYFRDIGWVIVDPAPQQTLVDMTTDPQNSLQQLLGDMLRNDASFDDFMQSQQSAAFNFQLLLNSLYALLLAALITAYSVKFYRIWIPSRAATNKQYRLSYRAMLDQLSAVGLHRRFGESREQFARRVEIVSPSMQEMTAQHLALALGSADKSSIDAGKWSQLRNAIAAEINHNTQTWKKVLAWLNPFSWLLSK
jgi:protein-glutamine gamma-glutamyltransferase